VRPRWKIRDGLGQAFEKGYDVPKVLVDDFNEVTYTAYKKTYDESGNYVSEGQLGKDLRSVRVPRLVIFGKDDRLVSPPLEAAAFYRREYKVRVAVVERASSLACMVVAQEAAEKPSATLSQFTTFHHASM
jgi:pimeloyl-ACP methyl ester carboxylesterase